MSQLDKLIAERPGVAEWSHAENCWYFAGRRYDTAERADHDAFNAHLKWSEEFVSYSRITINALRQALADERSKPGETR